MMRAVLLMTIASCLFAPVTAFVVPKPQPRAPLVQDEAKTSLTPRALPAGFATTNGSQFVVDGKTQYLAGTNAYWLPFLMNNADVDLALDQLSASGIKLLRIWGFNDVTTIPSDPNTVWFQYLSASGSIINTGANGLQRLDYVVASAEKRGIKLIIPFVNNWQDYGGVPAYTSAFGSGSSTWFKHDKAQAQYRLYISTLIARYADSPAIFSWQLANEPRCMFCSTDDIFNWATSTSAYIKSLDPYHMVSLGDEGMGLNGASWLPYWLIYGTDYWRNIQIKTLDFGTFHMYPSTWAVPLSFVGTWISSHAERCRYAGKPCYFEEYGIPSSQGHCSIMSGWQKTALATPGIAGDGFWQLGTKLSSGLTHDDTFTIYHDTDEWKCLVTQHVANIEAASI